jgi:hypothetical protein
MSTRCNSQRGAKSNIPIGGFLVHLAARQTALSFDGLGTERITEADLARDAHAVLEKVGLGTEVIIENGDHQAVAVIRSPRRCGRPITEILRDAKERGSTVTLDENFGRDLEEIIVSHQQPWNPPSWD